MPNLQQNETEQSKKEIDLLQGGLKKNEKSQNQFKNVSMHIGRIRVKKGQRMNLFQTKKTVNTIYNKKFIKKKITTPVSNKILCV